MIPFSSDDLERIDVCIAQAQRTTISHVLAIQLAELREKVQHARKLQQQRETINRHPI